MINFHFNTSSYRIIEFVLYLQQSSLIRGDVEDDKYVEMFYRYVLVDVCWKMSKKKELNSLRCWGAESEVGRSNSIYPNILFSIIIPIFTGRISTSNFFQ